MEYLIEIYSCNTIGKLIGSIMTTLFLTNRQEVTENLKQKSTKTNLEIVNVIESAQVIADINCLRLKQSRSN